MALNGLFCADVPLRNYSLTHSRLCDYSIDKKNKSVEHRLAYIFSVKLIRL